MCLTKFIFDVFFDFLHDNLIGDCIYSLGVLFHAFQTHCSVMVFFVNLFVTLFTISLAVYVGVRFVVVQIEICEAVWTLQ
jgi:hypothetical protein